MPVSFIWSSSFPVQFTLTSMRFVHSAQAYLDLFICFVFEFGIAIVYFLTVISGSCICFRGIRRSTNKPNELFCFGMCQVPNWKNINTFIVVEIELKSPNQYVYFFTLFSPIYLIFLWKYKKKISKFV